jgi:hypothetical protein
MEPNMLDLEMRILPLGGRFETRAVEFPYVPVEGVPKWMTNRLESREDT